MKCKLIVNRESGNYERLDVDALLKQLNCNAEVEIIDSNSNWSADDFDTVIVCGGDGTLHNALQKCGGKKLYYAPCGTLNETAFTEKRIDSLCHVNGAPFSYVCATGSFTEIGYTAKNNCKKRWKALAYLPQVVKNYRCHEIAARLNVDGKRFDGAYTLLMVLRSHRCFGFSFNKDYKTTKKNYLVAVKSVGKNSLGNKVKMFFPFFRIFFCGAKPKVTSKWMLLPFNDLTISLQAPQNFCVDGEKRILGGKLRFCTQTIEPPIEVVQTPLQRTRAKAFAKR